MAETRPRAGRDGIRAGTIFRMPPSSAVVTPDVVRRVAELARLRLPDTELPLWTGQLSRIVGYIEQLRQIPEPELAIPAQAPATPVRDDAPRDGAGAEALARNSPRQVHGYGAVPRVVGTGT